MSVRFDNAADRLLRTSDLFSYNSPYALMGWFYISTDLDARSHFMATSNNSSSNIDALRTTTSGTLLQLNVVSGGAGSTGNGSTLSVATWYHLAVVRESTTLLRLYLNGVSDATATRDVSARTANTRLEIGAILSTDVERFDGRAAFIKAYSTSLTVAEVLQEMHTIRPQRVDNLYGWWPTFPGSGERVKDYAGNGRDWTEAGTLTDEDGPPVSWGAPVWEVQIPAGGGGTNTPQTVDGTLTTAGTVGKGTGKDIGGTLSGAGTIARATSRLLTGALTASGALAKASAKSLAGTLSSAGAIVKATNKVLDGALSSSGALVTLKAVGQSVGGTLSLAGAIVRDTGKGLSGTLSPTGAVSKAISKAIGGTLSFLGTLLAALLGVTPHLDVEISDSAVYSVSLTTALAYAVTLSDSAVYTVALSDTTRS